MKLKVGRQASRLTDGQNRTFEWIQCRQEWRHIDILDSIRFMLKIEQLSQLKGNNNPIIAANWGEINQCITVYLSTSHTWNI